MLKLDVVDTDVSDIVFFGAWRHDPERWSLCYVFVAKNIDCETECPTVILWARDETLTVDTNAVSAIWRGDRLGQDGVGIAVRELEALTTDLDRGEGVARAAAAN